MAFVITNTCPDTIIFQTLDHFYDYSDCGSEEAAWEKEQSERWVKEAMSEGKSLQECENEFLESLTTTTKEEAKKAAEDGYAWPLVLGFVEQTDEE